MMADDDEGIERYWCRIGEGCEGMRRARWRPEDGPKDIVDRVLASRSEGVTDE
jgi:hypothetical protein